MRLDLRNRFLIPTALALVVAFGAYLAVTTQQTGAALEHAMLDEMAQLDRLLVQQIGSWLEHRDNDVARWATLPSIRDAGRDPASQAFFAQMVIQELAGAVMDYEAIHLVGPDGIATASSVEGMAGFLDVSERAYFQTCQQTGEPSHSQALASEITGEPVVVLCHPVCDSTGKPTGSVILGVVDLGALTAKLIDPIRIGETGYAYVCDRDGTVLAHPDHELILAHKISDWDFGKQIMAARQGHLAYAYEGSRKQSTFATEDQQGWLVAVTIDDSQIYAASRQLPFVGHIEQPILKAGRAKIRYQDLHDRHSLISLPGALLRQRRRTALAPMRHHAKKASIKPSVGRGITWLLISSPTWLAA